MKRTLAALAASGVILGGVIYLNNDEPAITLVNPQHVVWDKPETDEEWAEDVKAEQIDMRSTEVLTTMLAAQTEKLEEQKEAYRRYEHCDECIYWDYYEQFSQIMDEATAATEARAAATTAIAQRQWEIEKITQSIERIDRELDLRRKGFVIVEGEQVDIRLGGTVPTKRIRHIID